MKFIFFILALCLLPPSGRASINESAMVEPLLDIFNGKILRDGHVKVPVTTFNSLGDLRKNGSSKLMDPQKFQSLSTWANPVFRMQPAAKRNEVPRKGTAFHIGHNLVLTNQHVLDPERKNLTKCEDFRVTTQDDQVFPCKRVIFCNNPHDICLIEMAPKKNSCVLCRNPQVETLADRPGIKMRASYEPDSETAKNVIVTAIGNSMGLGIHVSQGRGILISPVETSTVLRFYSYATKGNSGGPILDEDGVMIGLVKQQSSFAGLSKHVINPVGDSTYNIALRVEKVISLCREALKDDQETLEKFNQAVIE